MTTAMDALCKAHAFATDKFSSGQVPHGYDLMYEPLFAPLRNKPIKLLELGVMYGESLKFWREYFLNAELFGLDLDPAVVPGVTMFKGSQDDPAVLAQAAKHGPFDIIIDDASHVGKFTTASFEFLKKHLAPGGIYAVEDLGAELAPRFHDQNPFTRTGVREVLCLAQTVRSYWKEIRVMSSMMVFVKGDES